ncbi:hypothetical protein MPTK1_3g21530 [Marchantia polymorpha subsp. ruderalis]|uniref:Protein kinase domain-containing protein n=2 Tax=Marchantia polymorpha TaxID=3197 RepID=A0AAF6B395_MARPO|nr:hypothetical protein MARPO_0089s0063 [Marchantia polymorpha]BBN06479.1 hypothetical protein Mp_3g21530 [Marchantia polymorpha subsp. ruderalis]|eukprot:PTQ33440.1 hypothetical protein MARPO_0089s0063 [Marchantia polymorpha]
MDTETMAASTGKGPASNDTASGHAPDAAIPPGVDGTAPAHEPQVATAPGVDETTPAPEPIVAKPPSKYVKRKKRNVVDTRGAEDSELRHRVRAQYITIKTLQDDKDVYKFYKKIVKIGEGASGKIYEVENANDGNERLAMKVQRKNEGGEGLKAEDLRRIYKELLITDKVLPPHEHIVQLEDVLVSPNKMFTVTQLYAKDITLHDFIKTCENTSARRVFKQIAETVRFMHKYGVVHMDLKPENVLFTAPDFMVTKVVDFSRAEVVGSLAKEVHNGFKISDWFSPEEVAEAAREGQPTVDVQSLGNILLSILSGKSLPFQTSGAKFTRAVAKLQPRRELFPAPALDLLSKIGPGKHGPKHVAELLTVEEICEHEWLLGQTSGETSRVEGTTAS